VNQVNVSSLQSTVHLPCTTPDTCGQYTLDLSCALSETANYSKDEMMYFSETLRYALCQQRGEKRGLTSRATGTHHLPSMVKTFSHKDRLAQCSNTLMAGGPNVVRKQLTTVTSREGDKIICTGWFNGASSLAGPMQVFSQYCWVYFWLSHCVEKAGRHGRPGKVQSSICRFSHVFLSPFAIRRLLVFRSINGRYLVSNVIILHLFSV